VREGTERYNDGESKITRRIKKRDRNRKRVIERQVERERRRVLVQKQTQTNSS
jgi:hypothetical protein